MGTRSMRGILNKSSVIKTLGYSFGSRLFYDIRLNGDGVFYDKVNLA
jgi:hypothetical protein